MAENQSPVPNLNEIINEIMNECVHGEEEVHMEPQPETVENVEPEAQPEIEEPTEERRTARRHEVVSLTEGIETEGDKDFISAEDKALWNKQMANKGFVSERVFGKMISLFAEIIERKGWEFFCTHKAPGFSAMAREFYANMVGIREDSVYVRGVWLNFGHKRITKVLQLKERKHGSKLKKLVENLDHGKIIDLLTARQRKWEATKKNPHHAINRGSLTEEAKVWFYFIASVILPTEHLCSVREQEAIILYALLKGCKMNVGSLIESSIRGYHLSNKRGLIPHPATITRLCILAGVKGSWEEEETCPKVSTLTLTSVIKRPRNKKQKRIIEVETDPAKENDNREIENFLERVSPVEEEELQFRMSPLSHLGPDLRENFSELAKSSRRNVGKDEILEMLIAMKKEMEEREDKWEKHQPIREEFLEAEFRRK